jgi:hypothetical protein
MANPGRRAAHADPAAALSELIRNEVRAAISEATPTLLAELEQRQRALAARPRWMTPREVRRIGRCRASEVFDAIRSGALPAQSVKSTGSTATRPGLIPKRWRIKPADADRWLDSRSQTA